MLISKRVLLISGALIGLTRPRLACAASEFEPDELDVQAVAALISARPTLLIDVRADDEFAVSHLADAMRVDLSISPEALVKRLDGRLKGAEIVIYCTVGTRSMGLGINAQDALLKAGVKGVHVMKDGLIAWANADLPLVDHRGATRFVHPSDQATRSRLTDPDRARFEPRT